MTRDEARDALLNKGIAGQMTAANFVAGLVALGLLKLDEPPSVVARAFDVMHPTIGGTYTTRVLEDLEAAGLKIVEKD